MSYPSLYFFRTPLDKWKFSVDGVESKEEFDFDSQAIREGQKEVKRIWNIRQSQMPNGNS